MKKRASHNAAPRAVVALCFLLPALFVAAFNLREIFPILAAALGFAFILLAAWLVGYSIEPV